MKSCAIIGAKNKEALGLALLLLNDGWRVYYLDDFEKVDSPYFIDCIYDKNFIFIDFNLLEKSLNINDLVDYVINYGPVEYENAKEIAKKQIMVKPKELSEHIYRDLIN